MNKFMTLFMIVLLSVWFDEVQGASPPQERVIWDKQPIPVSLAVGQERLIHFPGAIRYWLPDGAESALNVLAANGVLYLQARQVFKTLRVRVQAPQSQRLYLLDVVSTAAGDYPKNLMVTPKTAVDTPASLRPGAAGQSQAGLAATSAADTSAPIDWPIRLMRFAAQMLYAPERLSPRDYAIRRIAVEAHSRPLLRGAQTEALPLGQWVGGGLYVTAVRLRNLSDQTLWITPTRDTAASEAAEPQHTWLSLSHDLRGAWLYAAAQHSALRPAGDDADRTVLYLVSRHPFASAMAEVRP